MNLPRRSGDEPARSRRRAPHDIEDGAMSKSKPLIALRFWLRYRSNRRVLSQLSDRTLRDIGLSRSGIGYAAKVSAERLYAATPSTR
jgi:uncharacterized protein YjiS (DUF1127 family)